MVVNRIEVISARPDWVELLIPCTREAAERIQVFISSLDTDVSEELRKMIGRAFVQCSGVGRKT
jgi:hypothetical protein